MYRKEFKIVSCLWKIVIVNATSNDKVLPSAVQLQLLVSECISQKHNPVFVLFFTVINWLWNLDSQTNLCLILCFNRYISRCVQHINHVLEKKPKKGKDEEDFFAYKTVSFLDPYDAYVWLSPPMNYVDQSGLVACWHKKTTQKLREIYKCNRKWCTMYSNIIVVTYFTT